MPSRRAFLTQVSAATALGVISQAPGRLLWAAPAELVPEPDEALLRELALRAIEVARSAGATFADVRVASGCTTSVRCAYVRASGRPPRMLSPSVSLMAGYGVRAVVDGAWGFASGYALDPDAVTRAARSAVARAKANRPRHRQTLELAPLPVLESGRWAAPIEEDPFQVPFGQQADLQLAALAAAVPFPEVTSVAAGFSWTRIEQVFASTDGAVQVQQFYRGGPAVSVGAQVGEDYTRAGASATLRPSESFGFEQVTRNDLAAGTREAAEKAIAESKTLRPPRSVEVGRYDLVLSDGVAARLLADTIGTAVNLERALGYQANREGTSFAAPPADVVGRYQVASPLLTVRADRNRPGAQGTVGWDDEGVKPEAYTMVQDGIIVDYHTSRETAPALAAWYRSRGEPVRSHGCMAGIGPALPRVALPNLSVEPGEGNATVDDLIADTKRGIYVIGTDDGGTDQQLLSAQFGANFRQAREIRNGKLGARLEDVAYQFVTPTFWKHLDALGGPESRRLRTARSAPWRPEPLQLDVCSIDSVPMRMRQVNVLNTGRTA